MSDIINKGFVAMAERVAKSLSQETQTNAVIVIIAHSGDQLAVGYSHDAATETPASVKAMIEEAGREFTP